MKAWQAVRDEAMRGWVKCSDGRLYHPVVSEFAMEAWDRRKKERERKATYRAKYINGHGGGGEGQDADVPRDMTGTDQGQNPDRHGDGTVLRTCLELLTGKDRTRTGQEKEKKDRPLATLAPSAGAEAERDFEAFWQAFPRKVGRGAAVRAFAAACRKAPAAAIIAAVEQAVWSPNPRFIPHPTTWLHGERWTDEVEHPDAALLRVMSASRRDRAAHAAFLLRRASKRHHPPPMARHARQARRADGPATRGQGAGDMLPWLHHLPMPRSPWPASKPSRSSANGCRLWGTAEYIQPGGTNTALRYTTLPAPTSGGNASPGSGSQAKLGQASRQPTFTMAWQDADAAPNNGMRKAMRGWLARPVHTPCAAASCHAPTILAGGRKRNNPARAKYRTTEAGIPHAEQLAALKRAAE